jgi:succinate dehydrogenase / fumarate reductase flavoprotein subunit
MANESYETHEHDVLVIGAGGAGLRAAIEAAAQGVSVGLVCKSLLGKAHTVMAEGGIAAAMGNVWPEDNWQVHFRDTMRGGKMLNNWRMAQLHAQEAPDRACSSSSGGAPCSTAPRTGASCSATSAAHRYARLAHVGDRTGLEMIRTLQYHGIHQGIDVYMECKVEAAPEGRRPGGRRLRVLAQHRQVRSVQGQGDRARHRRGRQGVEGHVELLGIHRRRAVARPVGGR